MKYKPSKNKYLITSQLTSLLKTYRGNRNFSPKFYVEQKAKLLNEYMRNFNLSSCVLGVSGGIDSAVVLGVANYAKRQPNSPIRNIIPISLPVYDSGATNQLEANQKASELCSTLGLELITFNVTNPFLSILNEVENKLNSKGEDWARGQLVAYTRTPMLYYVTSLCSEKGEPAIILGTNNKDEGAYLGYFGKASDGMVDLQMISDIHKSEVYQVAKFLQIPRSITSAIPSGDMYDNRSDEDVFGASYDFVELYLAYLGGKISIADLKNESLIQFKEMAENIEKLHSYNGHKYLSCSPAIHLDLPELAYNVADGWEYNVWK